jgi:ribosomal 30S subunit maturation factor RimM
MWASIWLLRRLCWQIFGSCGSVGKFGSCRGTAGKFSFTVNSAPLANLALSTQWLDKRRAHEQQKQTTTNRTTMGNRLIYFGVDDANRETKKITHWTADNYEGGRRREK